MSSRRLILNTIATLAVLATLSPLAPPDIARASSRPCRVTNARSDEIYVGYGHNLQRAIDAAERHDRLIVQGVCVGSFTASRHITLAGRPSHRADAPTLDGDGQGHVLDFSHGATIRSLLIRDGRATRGGGIYLRSGRLVLEGHTIVARNRASSGGGIAVSEGRLILADVATVRGNAAASGGGIWFNLPGSVLMKDRSMVRGNRARDSGGGVEANVGKLVMTDLASVRGNVAHSFGGGIANLDGYLELRSRVSVIHNTAGRQGGGIYNYFSQMLVCSPLVVLSPNEPDDLGAIAVGC